MKLGLVLGGGTAKGAFQVGVLKALARVFPPESFSCISASSIGVLNAYAFCTDQMEGAENLWYHLPFTSLPAFARYVRREDYFERLLEGFEFRKSAIPDFYITYLELANLALHYYNLGTADPSAHALYLKAGVAIPPFCRPVKIDGARCLDGALVDNIPITPLLKHGCDYIITVYFDKDDYVFFDDETDRRILRINLMDQGIVRDTFKFEELFLRELVQKGEEVCSRKLEIWAPRIARGEPVPEPETDETEKKKRIQFTGDMLLNRVNAAASRIAQYRISDEEKGEQR